MIRASSYGSVSRKCKEIFLKPANNCTFERNCRNWSCNFLDIGSRFSWKVIIFQKRVRAFDSVLFCPFVPLSVIKFSRNLIEKKRDKNPDVIIIYWREAQNDFSYYSCWRTGQKNLLTKVIQVFYYLGNGFRWPARFDSIPWSVKFIII